MNTRARVLLAGCSLAVSLAACSGSDQPAGSSTAAAARVEIVSGDDQTAGAGQELAESLVARVVDADGRGIRGQIVNFHVTGGGGSVYGGVQLSDANGVARERWTLGPYSGIQTLEARAVDNSTGAPIVFGVFHATAVGGIPPPPPPGTLRIQGCLANAPVGTQITLAGDRTATTTTDGTHCYAFDALPPGSYVVTPTRPSWIFFPVSRSVVVVAADVPMQDFEGMAAAPPYISGTISGPNVAGVTLTGGSLYRSFWMTSDFFVYSSLAPATYVLTPEPLYADVDVPLPIHCTPASRTIVIEGAVSVPDQDFICN